MMFFPSKITSWALFISVLHFASTNGEGCEKVEKWNDLVRFTNTAMNKKQSEVCFEPFKIDKPTSSRLMLNRPIILRCGKHTSDDKCEINGSGHHFRIAGRNAKITIVGFTFVGATDSAVRLISTSKQTHTLDRCDFLNNRGTFDGWRGGAIKTESLTSLVITFCTFDGNAAAGGGAIFHKGKHLSISESSFRENLAKEGGAIKGAAGSTVDIANCIFIDNSATKTAGGAIEMNGFNTLELGDSVTGYGNSGCEGIWDRNTRTCRSWLSTGPDEPSFNLGDLTVNLFGMKLSAGLSAKILAKAGQRIPFTSPDRNSDRSSRQFHTNPDGAAVFELDDGWIYISNAENLNSNGGVYGVEFDSRGNVRDYVVRLTGTTRNCSGGATPWNSWVSCEEYGKGQCWQVDPKGMRKPAKTKLVEPAGGNFESMAYDITDPSLPRFYVTEDHERGALRRFTPPCSDLGLSWNLIQLKGDIDYLYFTSDNTFEWTTSLKLGRDSAQANYRYVEGISFKDGILSFVAKRQKLLFHLDLSKGTYEVESTNRGNIPGGGTFGAGPDQLVQNGDYLYFTEDGGGNPGVYVTDGISYFTLFEARASQYRGDETTGLAFSPDGTRLYVCLQEIGYLFEITRDDGLPFPGDRTVSTLRFHNQKEGQ